MHIPRRRLQCRPAAEFEADDGESKMGGVKNRSNPLKHKARIRGQVKVSVDVLISTRISNGLQAVHRRFSIVTRERRRVFAEEAKCRSYS